MQTFNFICVTTNEYSKNFIELINSINNLKTDHSIIKNKYVYSMGKTGVDFSEDEKTINNPNLVGLSKARNDLIKKVKNGYLIFCDDDAIYDKYFLIEISKKITDKNCGKAYIVKLLNKENDSTYGNRKYPAITKKVSRREAVKIGISLNLILESDIVKSIGLFDESLGVGSPGLAGEETDIILRLLNKDVSFEYLDGITVRHPSQNTENTNYLKVYQYAFGYRKMIDASRVDLNLKIICYILIVEMIFKNLLAIIVKFDQRKVRWMRIKGLLLI